MYVFSICICRSAQGFCVAARFRPTFHQCHQVLSWSSCLTLSNFSHTVSLALASSWCNVFHRTMFFVFTFWLFVTYLHWCSYPLPNASLVTSICPMTLNAPGFLLLVLCIFIDLSFWMVTLVFDSLDRGFISCWNSSLLLYIRNLFCYIIKFLTSETAGCVTLTEPGPSRHPSSTSANKNIGVI